MNKTQEPQWTDEERSIIRCWLRYPQQYESHPAIIKHNAWQADVRQQQAAEKQQRRQAAHEQDKAKIAAASNLVRQFPRIGQAEFNHRIKSLCGQNRVWLN